MLYKFLQALLTPADVKTISQTDHAETSPISSRNSSPDSQRRSSRHDSIGSSMSGGSYSTPQINFLQKQKELREQQHQQQSSPSTPNSPQSPQSPQSVNSSVYNADKPPIPPRGLPPPVPQRQSSTDNSTVVLRARNGKYENDFNFSL